MVANTQPAADLAAPQSETLVTTSGNELAVQTQQALVNQGDNVRASWRFSLDNIRSNTAYMSPEAKELLAWAFLWCTDKAHPIFFEDFCARAGYNTNTIYKLYSGKYKHPESGLKMDAPEKLLKAIKSFRRLEVSRAKLGAKKFVMTKTAETVYWGIEQARKSGRPVMIYGGSQIGKTEAFKQNSVDFNHGKTVLVEIEAVNGLRGLLQAIAVKLGISPRANTPDLIERIKNALTSDMVLILDEVHLLANVYRKGSFFACMEQIRRLWDAKKFGLVLSYTDLGYDRAEKERKRELMQIFRRGVIKVNLGNVPLVEDVQAIAESFGLPWAERHDEIAVDDGVIDSPMKVLRQLAEDDGLTAIIERIRIAHEIAAGRTSDDVTWQDFMLAHFSIVRKAQAPKSGWETNSRAA
jgi:DNA transposition AAA+ family ATPase